VINSSVLTALVQIVIRDMWLTSLTLCHLKHNIATALLASPMDHTVVGKGKGKVVPVLN